MNKSYDAIVVGSGPNGLTAGIVLAEKGLSVLVVEAKETIGGGSRTAEVAAPGFWSDICGAIHPVGIVSPIFRHLKIEQYGLDWIYPPAPLAHPFDDGTAAVMEVSLDALDTLGEDANAWGDLMRPFLKHGTDFFNDILKPIRIPSHPITMARFGLTGLRSCSGLVRSRFKGRNARSLFAGCAAHSVLDLDRFGTASFGMVLALSGHAINWPLAKEGSRRIVEALATRLKQLGGEIVTGFEVKKLEELPASRAVLFDLTPRQIARIAGHVLPDGYRRKLERFRHGPGVFKVDWALDGPIPWKAEECFRAATVHVGGSYEEVELSEKQMASGKVPEKPFVLVAQQSLFDPSRAPEGKHTGWAYCHVPNGCTVDMTDAIERQIERFAPGFRDRIIARRSMSPLDVERHNANMIGGDIGGGANNIMQFIFRPFPRFDPYSTPNDRLFICSSSTPPGGGVHGMCGYWGAKSALKKVFGK